VYFKEINGDSQEFNLMCETVSEAELAETSFLGEEEDAAGYKHIFDDGYDIYLVLAKPVVLTHWFSRRLDCNHSLSTSIQHASIQIL